MSNSEKKIKRYPLLTSYVETVLREEMKVINLINREWQVFEASSDE